MSCFIKGAVGAPLLAMAMWITAAAQDPFDDPFGGPADPTRPAPSVKKKDAAQSKPVDRLPSTNDDAAKALEKPFTFEFKETPLHDVRDFIRDLVKVNVELDGKALDDYGIGEDVPVTFKAKKMRLKSALRHILDPLDLSHCVRNGAIVITTPEAEDDRMIVQTYNVGDLLAGDNPLVEHGGAFAKDTLIEAITSMVEPDTWEDVGGPGSLNFFGKLLVVSQSWQVQQEVEQTLSTLRRAQRVVKQSGRRPPETTFVVVSQAKDDEFAAPINAALDKKISLDFDKTSLHDAASFLADKSGINIIIDTRGLDDVGIGVTAPVTFKVEQIMLRSALSSMLRELDMTWTIRNDAILLTTPEEVESRLETRIYPVLDLVLPQEGGDFLVDDWEAKGDYDTLIGLITYLVKPVTWDDVGGPGAVKPINGCLMISQTLDTFREVDQVLAGYRRLLAEYRRAEGKSVTLPILLDDRAHSKIRAALNRETGMAAFQKTPLENVAGQLAKRMDVPVHLDLRGFEDIGLSQDTPITATLGGETYGQALRRILRPLELTWVVTNELLLITTTEEAEYHMDVRIYPVRDILAASATRLDDEPADIADLIDVLTSTVHVESWDEAGGPGAIEGIAAHGALFVAQTEEIHEAIAQLLESLRRSQREAAKESKAAPVDASDKELPTNKQDKKLYLKVYRLDVSGAEQSKKLADIVRELVEPHSWKSDEPYYLRSLSGALIIRQTAPAHRKIHRLLRELDVLPIEFGARGFGSAQPGRSPGFF